MSREQGKLSVILRESTDPVPARHGAPRALGQRYPSARGEQRVHRHPHVGGFICDSKLKIYRRVGIWLQCSVSHLSISMAATRPGLRDSDRQILRAARAMTVWISDLDQGRTGPVNTPAPPPPATSRLHTHTHARAHARAQSDTKSHTHTHTHMRAHARARTVGH